MMPRPDAEATIGQASSPHRFGSPASPPDPENAEPIEQPKRLGPFLVWPDEDEEDEIKQELQSRQNRRRSDDVISSSCEHHDDIGSVNSSSSRSLVRLGIRQARTCPREDVIFSAGSVSPGTTDPRALAPSSSSTSAGGNETTVATSAVVPTGIPPAPSTKSKRGVSAPSEKAPPAPALDTVMERKGRSADSPSSARPPRPKSEESPAHWRVLSLPVAPASLFRRITGGGTDGDCDMHIDDRMKARTGSVKYVVKSSGARSGTGSDRTYNSDESAILAKLGSTSRKSESR